MLSPLCDDASSHNGSLRHTRSYCGYMPYSARLKQLLTPPERRAFQKLSTPQKIQDFLDDLPINFELLGETYMSPRPSRRQAVGALSVRPIMRFCGIATRSTSLCVSSRCRLSMNTLWTTDANPCARIRRRLVSHDIRRTSG